MKQRLGVFLVAIVAMALASVCQAQPQRLLTNHVRDVVFNGEAPFVGKLPATQPMRIDIVLPVREGLDSFLHDVYDPSSPTYRQFLTVSSLPRGSVPAREILTRWSVSRRPTALP